MGTLLHKLKSRMPCTSEEVFVSYLVLAGLGSQSRSAEPWSQPILEELELELEPF